MRAIACISGLTVGNVIVGVITGDYSAVVERSFFQAVAIAVYAWMMS